MFQFSVSALLFDFQEQNLFMQLPLMQDCPEETISSRMSQCQSNNEVKFIDGMTYDWKYNPAIPTTSK